MNTPSHPGVASCFPDEGSHQIGELLRVGCGVFRMPLHADNPRLGGIHTRTVSLRSRKFDRFDRAVVGHGGHAQPVTKSRNGLVVAAANRQDDRLGRPHVASNSGAPDSSTATYTGPDPDPDAIDPPQHTVRRNRHLVLSEHRTIHGVAVRRAGPQILHQGATQGHVEQLHPPADSQHGQALGYRRAGQLHLKGVGRGIRPIHRRIRMLPIGRRIDIGTAQHQNAVKANRQFSRVILSPASIDEHDLGPGILKRCCRRLGQRVQDVAQPLRRSIRIHRIGGQDAAAGQDGVGHVTKLKDAPAAPHHWMQNSFPSGSCIT